ncbi:MAG: apolipoprotein N-acyltransferase [Cellvibrionaceae bacterium]
MSSLTQRIRASRLPQSLSAQWRYLFALGSGCLMPLALAPLELWPLAAIAPAILAWLCWQQPSRTLILTHFFFGLGMFGVGISWVYVSIHDFGNAPLPLAVLLTAIFVTFLAAVFSLNGKLLGLTPLRQARSISQFLLCFCSVWVLGEWLRSWLLTGFPWLYLGYSQWATPLAGWAPITGVFGLSWAIAISGCASLYILMTRKRSAQCFAAALVAGLWLGGDQLQKVQWTHASAKAIDVALVQANIPQEKKWQPDFLMPTLERYRDLSAQAWSADWLIWPEAAVPMLYHQATGYLEQTHQQALNTQTALITGILYDDPRQRKIYNSANGLGLATGLYHKTRLVPFGEYVPLEDWLRGLIEFFNLPMSVISPGVDTQRGLQAGDHRIATAICYEIVYPDLVGKMAKDREVILTLSNDAWFGASWGPLQHLEMAQMRALETGRYVIRATNNGISAIISNNGHPQQKSTQFVQEVLRGDVVPMVGTTPFMRWGSALVIGLCALVLGLCAALNYRNSP